MSKKISLGVLGKNISYSLSPVIYGAWFDHFNMDGDCCLVQKNRFDFDEISFEFAKYYGWAITVPYKEKIFEWLKQHAFASWDGWVGKLGIANIIKSKEDHVMATNTDAMALNFFVSQSDYAQKLKFCKNVLILGGGGVAKTSEVVLKNFQHEQELFTIYKAQRNIKKNERENNISLYDFKTMEKIGFDVVINATPLGTSRDEETVLLNEISAVLRQKKVSLVIDWAYDLTPTFWDKWVKQEDISFLGGVDLLIYQASFAFEFWFGLVPPIDLAKQALINALSQKKV